MQPVRDRHPPTFAPAAVGFRVPGRGGSGEADGAIRALPSLAHLWFRTAFGTPTPPQVLAWTAASGTGDRLLVAPTGSGKTLAAFLPALGRLADQARAHPADRTGVHRPPAGVHVLYVSPLRALDADIHHNLRAPIHGLVSLARDDGWRLAIDHDVRTGDTSATQRRSQRERPPHVLITTPESLFLLLGSPAWQAHLAGVAEVVVDELHAVADGKRGSHLSLTLARLDALCGRHVPRLGLTATAEPLDALARLLAGRGEGRTVSVLDARAARSVEIVVDAAPEGDRSPKDPRIEPAADLVAASQRALVFVGSRVLAERTRQPLEEALGRRVEDPENARVGVHHGSLARGLRTRVEHGLRDGALRAVVATSSLELRIDVGAVDRVVQFGAPGGVAQLLQRVGRAGHRPTETPRATLLSRGGVDLLESAILARLALDRALDPIRIPEAPLDVLAQHLLAHAAASPDGSVRLDAFRAIVLEAEPYATVTLDTLERIAHDLSRDRAHAPRLVFDAVQRTVTVPDGVRKLVRSVSGTIASRGLYRMLDAGTRETLGELDEEFIHESRVGDRFNFGLSVYTITAIRSDAVLVRRAPETVRGRMPFWKGDRPMRSAVDGQRLGAWVREIQTLEPDALRARLPLTEAAAERLADVLAMQARAGALPHDRRIVAETYRDPLGEGRLAVHAWHGRKVLEPWLLALGHAIASREGALPRAVATDNGMLFALPSGTSTDPMALLRSVTAEAAPRLVHDAVMSTPWAAASFREAAERALVMPRLPKGRRTPLWMNRQRATTLRTRLADPEHFLEREVAREILHDRWEIGALCALLRALQDGTCHLDVVERRTPSPFARTLESVFTASHLYDEDAPAAERRLAAVEEGHGGTFAAPAWLPDGTPCEDHVAQGTDAVTALRNGTAAVRLEALLLADPDGPEGARARLDEAAARGELVIARSHEADGTTAWAAAWTPVWNRLRAGALDRARKAIRPVPVAVWQDWLLAHHGLGTAAGTGIEPSKILASLDGAWLPAEIVEADILRARFRRYDPGWLDLACARGELRWHMRAMPARIRLQDGSTRLGIPASETHDALEGDDATMLAALRARGASFAADVIVASGLPVRRGHAALLSLLSQGWIANDAFAAARALITGPGAAGVVRAGRYEALTSVPDDDLDAWADRLLRRWGVVSREHVAQDPDAPSWEALREVLHARVIRGTLQNGEIVAGVGGLQYATRETVDALRAHAERPLSVTALLSAKDPLFVVTTEGVQRSANVRWIVHGGNPSVRVDRHGATLTETAPLREMERAEAVRALTSLAQLPAALRPFRTLRVEQVDGTDAVHSPWRAAFVEAGWEADAGAYVLPSWRL